VIYPLGFSQILMSTGINLFMFGQYTYKSLLGNLNVANHLHPLLPLCLQLEQLHLTADVTAVALCRYVLPQRLHVLSRLNKQKI
jgi:hypothetical protein